MNDRKSGLETLRRIFGGSWISQGIWVAAELGIADLLVGGPQTAEALAPGAGADVDALYRLLRALASVGIFAEDEQRRFALTPLAEFLRSDAADSQRAYATMIGAEFYQAWGELLYSVQTGKPGFEKKFGTPFFQYMTEHPERHAIYDRAMAAVHGTETGPMLDAYDFSAFRSLVDIGGGNGLLLAAVLERHPAIRGKLYDLPAVVERARPMIAGMSVSSRYDFQGGDFFGAVPAGADAYLLRHIIHDWQDREALAILRNCREAMRPDSKLLIIEMLIAGNNQPGFAKWLDLMMLLVAGRERTEADYQELFDAAGLKLTRIIPTAAEVSIVEGVRA